MSPLRNSTLVNKLVCLPIKNISKVFALFLGHAEFGILLNSIVTSFSIQQFDSDNDKVRIRDAVLVYSIHLHLLDILLVLTFEVVH